MAQNQKIEYLFAAQVTGQNELKKLTDAVDSLRKEMEALKAASGGVGTSTQQFTKSIGNASSHVQAYQKHLDAQAKAMRNHRQGTQQLGMQFNDLGTSISTGASPIQAFNQQLGQMGYALSMMEGKAGSVGAFLAGPWGAAIVLATMAVGFLVEKFDLLGMESDNTKSAIKSLSDNFDLASASAADLAAINELLAEANRKVAATSIQAANATAAKAASDANAEQKAINNTRAILLKERAELASLKRIAAAQGKLSSNFGKDRVFASMGASAIIGVQSGDVETLEKSVAAMEQSLQGFAMVSRRASAESYSLSAAMDVNARATERHQQVVNNLTNSYASGKITQEKFRKGIDAENAAYKALQKTTEISRRSGSVSSDRMRTGKSDLEKQQEKDAKTLEDFFNLIDRGNKKELPEYARQVMAIEEAFLKLNAAQQASDKNRFTKIFAQEKIFQKEGQDQVSDYLKTPIEAPQMSKEMEDIISKADEMNKSFEAIGNAVANSFKGMLTGAMSFKSAMKGIISAVIDELFRLYVVQQIVGIVSGALGGTSSMPGNMGDASSALDLIKVPGFAGGTNYAPGGMALVGERGPELVNLPRGSQVIPNHKLGRSGEGGSSFNISVDARGSNDPAAVRAQVQQGILEAAPAIIAAAESRTIAGLRRPRLGGAMQ